MKKILFIAALVVALCLATAAANGAAPYSFQDTDVVTFTGKTGFARLEVEKISFHFDRIQPGERLGVSWWIWNNGPCPLGVKVTVIVSGNPAAYLVPVFYPGTTLQMGPNLCKNVALTVKMKNNAPNWTANESFTVTVTFKSIAKGNRWESPYYQTW